MEKKKDKKEEKKEEKENYKSSHNKYKRYRCIFQGCFDWTKQVKWRYKKTISSLFLGIDHLLDGWKHEKKRRWYLIICLNLTSTMFIIVQRPQVLERCKQNTSGNEGNLQMDIFHLFWFWIHYISCLFKMTPIICMYYKWIQRILLQWVWEGERYRKRESVCVWCTSWSDG